MVSDQGLRVHNFPGGFSETQCHLVKTLSRQPLAEQGI